MHHVAQLLVLQPGLGLLQHGARAASRGLARGQEPSLGLLQLAGQGGDQGELSAAEEKLDLEVSTLKLLLSLEGNV